jgi:hypothetical protein
MFRNLKTPKRPKEQLVKVEKEQVKTIMVTLKNLSARMSHGEAEKFSTTPS